MAGPEDQRRLETDKTDAPEKAEVVGQTGKNIHKALASVDDSLNIHKDKPGEVSVALTDVEKGLEEEKAQPDILLEEVKDLMAKKVETLTDAESLKLSSYYNQEASRWQAQGETWKAIMLYAKSLFVSLKTDFLSGPLEIAQKSNDDNSDSSETGNLTTPSLPQKPTELTVAEKAVEAVAEKNKLPQTALLAICRVENKPVTAENLEEIAKKVNASLGKEKPVNASAAELVMIYIRKSLNIKGTDEASNKRTAEEFAKYQLAINKMYSTKEISLYTYRNWNSLKLETENVKPGTLVNMLTPQWRKRMTPAKIANINMIQNMTIQSGYSLRMAAAMVANAWHESGIRSDAVGDSGNSVGLFQLHKRGAGHGMTQQERMVPENNIRRILEVTNKTKIKGPNGRQMSFKEIDQQGASIGKLAELFCFYVERPAKKVTSAPARGKVATNMFNLQATV